MRFRTVPSREHDTLLSIGADKVNFYTFISGQDWSQGLGRTEYIQDARNQVRLVNNEYEKDVLRNLATSEPGWSGSLKQVYMEIAGGKMKVHNGKTV